MVKPRFVKAKEKLSKLVGFFRRPFVSTSKVNSNVIENNNSFSKPSSPLKLVVFLPQKESRGGRHNQNRLSKKKASTLLSLMKHGDLVEESKGAIVRTQQGFVVDRGNLPPRVEDYFISKSQSMQNPRVAKNANLERVRIIQQLSKLGFRVAVPRYVQVNNQATNLFPKIKNYARTFEVKKMLRFDFLSYVDDLYPGKHPLKKEAVPHNNYWARDIYKKIGKKRVPFAVSAHPDIGEGGLSVDISPNVLFASHRLEEDYYVKELIQNGHKVYFLPAKGNLFDSNLSRAFKTKVFMRQSHVDLFIGVVGKNVLVDPYFLKDNQEVIMQAAREQQLKIIQIPSSEIIYNPANFLVLGPNEVLLERRAIKTKRVLEQAGVKVHLTAVPLKANLELGGGVRCIVNEV